MANESQKSFSPLNHVITYGAIVISGYASGSYLEIKPNTDLTDELSGADGEVNVNAIANGTATATIRMSYSNPTYKLMRAAAALQQTILNYLPFSSTNISDISDTTFSANAHIKRHSDDIYAVNATDMIRTYTIFLHNAIRV